MENKQKNSNNKKLENQTIDKAIFLTSYRTDDFGEVETVDEGYQLSTENQSFVYSNTNPDLDQKLKDFLYEAGIFTASLDNDAVMHPLHDDLSLASQCYYSIFEKKKKLFFLDTEHQPLDFLVDLGLNFKIQFAGIVCLDHNSHLEFFAQDQSILGDNIEFFDAKSVSLFNSSFSLKSLNRKIDVTTKEEGTRADRSLDAERISPQDISSTESIDVESSSSSQRIHKVENIRPEIRRDKIKDIKNKNPFVSGWGGLKKFFVKSASNEEPKTIVDDLVNKLSKVKLIEVDHEGKPMKYGEGKFPGGGSYRVEKILGQGSFGFVYQVSVKKGLKKQKYAVKSFRTINTMTKKNPDRLQKLPFFMKDFGVSENGKIQIQELGGTDLFSVFQNGSLQGINGRNKKARGEVFTDVFLGVSALHRKGYRTEKEGLVHWDLKPENILQGKDHRIKIIDLDDVSSPSFGGEVGTFVYMPLERKFNNFYPGASRVQVDAKSDIYSLGIMLGEAKYARGSLGSIADACCQIQSNMDKFEKNYVNNIHLFNQNKMDLQQYKVNQRKAFSQMRKENIKVFNRLLKFYQTNKDRMIPSERVEMSLMMNMLHPNSQERPNIQEVQRVWKMIHPPHKRAMRDAQVISSYFEREKKLAAENYEKRAALQREQSLITENESSDAVSEDFVPRSVESNF
ncbi:MAG: hypothetical protein AB8C84_11210 [Oligoflexales bacterium]